MTAELIISNEFQLFAPEFLLAEFTKYEKLIIKKTHRLTKGFEKFLSVLDDCITVILQKEIMPYLKQAREFSPDPKDAVYLALAIAIKSAIWSNDKKLKERQNHIKVFCTSDLVSIIRTIKKKK